MEGCIPIPILGKLRSIIENIEMEREDIMDEILQQVKEQFTNEEKIKLFECLHNL